jgi:C1A family cysteine protease
VQISHTSRGISKPLKVERANVDSLNYFMLGYVNPVQRQKKCGSCYVFSALAALEGRTVLFFWCHEPNLHFQ